MSEAAVSVIMAAFNAAPCIDRAIDSVVAQTFQHWELLVIDDSSSDETAGRVLARSRTDGRIKLFRQIANRGPSAARNVGLERATGRWVTILDADDAFMPDRLARMLAVAGETGADFVADNLLSYDLAAGRITGAAYAIASLRRLSLFDFLEREMSRSLALGFVKPLIRADLLRKNGVRYDETLRYAEDFTLYSELMLSGAKAWMMPEPLYIYTRQIGGVSGQASTLSRTRYTPWTRLEIVQRLTSKYATTMTRTECAMMERFRMWATTYAHAHGMSEHKNAGRYGEMAELMLRQPKAAVRFILAQRPLRTLFGTGF